MSTSYNPNYPHPTDSAANDVQTMQNNAMAIYNIWTKDHYTFENANNYDGLHAQVTIPANNVPMSLPTGLSSIIYTQPGVANTNASQLIYSNSGATFPASSIAAFGTFQTISGTGNVTLLNGFNVTSPIVVVSPTVYPIILTPNCVTGQNYCIIPYINNVSGRVTYSYISGVLNLTVTGSGQVSFIILQV